MKNIFLASLFASSLFAAHAVLPHDQQNTPPVPTKKAESNNSKEKNIIIIEGLITDMNVDEDNASAGIELSEKYKNTIISGKDEMTTNYGLIFHYDKKYSDEINKIYNDKLKKRFTFKHIKKKMKGVKIPRSVYELKSIKDIEN